MKYRFKQSLVEVGDSFEILTYDLQQNRLVDFLCDYATFLIVDNQLSRLTSQQAMGHLRVFWAYLASVDITELHDLNDGVLRKFRDTALVSVMDGPSFRGSRHAAEQTVNAKLIRIYDWLWWLQDTDRIRPGLIGLREAPVLSESKASARHQAGSRFLSSKRSTRYPLLYRVQTARSKHALPKTMPTEKSLDDVHAYFDAHSSSRYLFHRNTLIADIASCTGFRRASIQSLRLDQFIGRDFVSTHRGTVILKPDRQKFDYANTFEIPEFLHEQVKQFVNTHRRSFVESRQISAKEHKGMLLISARTGRPLTDRALTSVMARAMRAIGGVKGTALHAWRAKFAVEAVENEYADRSALGLDTSAETIERAVSIKLGQREPMSVRPYTSWHEAGEVSRRRASEEAQRSKDKLRIQELEALLDARNGGLA